ncbi:hypothetical protein TWF281_005511 [Arthrobotrys megalospora]
MLARPAAGEILTTTTIWSTVRSTSTIISDTCSCPVLPFCKAIQWPAPSPGPSSSLVPTPTSSPIRPSTSLQPTQTIVPGQEFQIGVSIPGNDFFLRIGVNIGLVDVVDPTGNEQTYFVDADGYLHYAPDPTQILYFPPFSTSGLRRTRQQQSLIAIFKYKDIDLLTDTDIATRFEVFASWLRLMTNGSVLNFYIAFRNETSTGSTGKRQTSVRGLYIVEDEYNLPPGFQRATVTPVIPPPTSSSSISIPSTIATSRPISTRTTLSSKLSTITASASPSSSSSDTSSSSSATEEPDAYSIIMSQSFFPFCSSLLDYSTETALILSGGETTSTLTVNFTSTEYLVEPSPSTTSTTTTSTLVSYESTTSSLSRQKRLLDTPTALASFPAMTLTSACSKAVSAPTSTSRSTSSLPPTKITTTTSSNPITTESSTSYQLTTSTGVSVSVSTVEASIETGFLAIPPDDPATPPTSWLRCSENSGSRPYGAGKYLIYEQRTACQDTFINNRNLTVWIDLSTRLNVVQATTDASNSGKDFLFCVTGDDLPGTTKPWVYVTNFNSDGTVADLVLDPSGSPGRETLFAWCEYPDYTNSDGITIVAASYLSLAPNNTVKPDHAISCVYYDHLYWSAPI